MKHANIQSLISTTIRGIPCLIEVTEAGVGKVYDRKGYAAKWLEAKMTAVDTAKVAALISARQPASKQDSARALFDKLNGVVSAYQIAKRIAAELNITFGNANYYVARFTGKR